VYATVLKTAQDGPFETRFSFTLLEGDASSSVLILFTSIPNIPPSFQAKDWSLQPFLPAEISNLTVTSVELICLRLPVY
jgi:hypothetical protein